MALNLQTLDIPWLRQPNSGEFFQGAINTGVNLGRSMGEGFSRGQNAAQQSAMLPLQKIQMENQIKSQSLDIESALLQQQDGLINKHAFSQLSRAAAEISAQGAWAKPESEKRVWEIAAANPSVMQTPQFMGVIKQFDTAGAAALKLREAEDRAAKSQQVAEIQREQIAGLNQRAMLKSATEENIADKNNATKLKVFQMKADSLQKEFNDGYASLMSKTLYRAFSEDLAKNSNDAAEGLITEYGYQRRRAEILENAQKAVEEARGSKPASAAPAAPAQTSTNEVARKLKDGRSAIFDAQTKKFLRYAD